MAKIIEIDAYNLLNKKSSKEYINAEHVIKVEDLITYDDKPLTRIKLINGDFYDTQKSVSDIMKIIN